MKYFPVIVCTLFILGWSTQSSVAQNVPYTDSHPYCAKPLAAKPKCDSGNRPTPFLGLTDVWPTSAIPVTFNSNVNAQLKQAVVEVLVDVEKKIGLEFYQCTALDPLDKFTVMEFTNTGNCASYVGWNPSLTSTPPFPGLGRSHQIEIGGTDGNGNPVCDQRNKGGILHEVIHALGLHHAHHHKDVLGKKILMPDSSALTEAAALPLNPGLIQFGQLRVSEYDYYSITHYNCNFMGKGTQYNRHAIKLKKQGYMPFYSHTNTALNSCYTWNNTNLYRGSDVGQEACLSKIDQEILSDAYFSPLSWVECDKHQLAMKPSCKKIQ
jgi:hypothetical protein